MKYKLKETLPPKGKDIKAYDAGGNCSYVYRCNCKNDKCISFRCQISGGEMIKRFVEWEYDV